MAAGKNPGPGRDRIRLVIFDSDGTLIDSRTAHRSFYGRLKLDLGLDPLSTREEDFVFVSTFDQALQRLIPSGQHHKARARAGSLRKSHFLPLVEPQPGIERFLNLLRKAGLLLAVNTNAGREVLEIYDRLNLNRFFDLVVTAEDVNQPKPEPEGVKKILDRLGLEAGAAVFVGDSDIDRQTAGQAGVRFWAYGNDRLKAEVHLDGYSIPALAGLID